MVPTLAVLLLVLSHFDPVGWYYATRYEIRAQSAAWPDGRHFAGLAFWNPNYMVVDLPWIWANEGLSANDKVIFAMCVLPHEAEHIRSRSAEELNPLRASYVCIDRAGGSQSLKDGVYEAMRSLTQRDPEAD